MNQLSHVLKYRYGTPIPTDALIVSDIPLATDLTPLELTPNGFTYTLPSQVPVYGLGENIRGINKRGWIYESFCSDEFLHAEGKKALYAAHNFLIVGSEQPFSIFIDYPGFISFDVGYTDIDQLTITPDTLDLDLYVIKGATPLEIVKTFRALIGLSYIPPKWAFGYQQSRWGYKTSDDVREVVKNFKAYNIPLDTVYLDIDYMDHFKDFTLSEEAFPHFEQFVQEMKAEHVRLIPIIDAGVKIEKGYATYEEGIQNHYFITDADGKPYEAAVWPGLVHFPDFLNSKARHWFGKQYAFLLDKGVEGFWNDMNEPSIFYTPSAVADAMSTAYEHYGKSLDLETFNHIKWKFEGIANRSDYYKEMYHNLDGEKVCHYDVHNLYGYNMTRAASEAFTTLRPDKRTLLFSRASYIGMHRYGGIWTGDNASWWSHILLNLKMMPSLNMCGFMYCGADIGGFSGDATEELLTRWLQLGIFTPLCRNHAAWDTRSQEPYQFKYVERLKKWIALRYALIPYLYSEYMKATLSHDMLFKPLAFEYADDHCKEVEDQLLVGESIMIAPIYEANKTGRYVYLPEDMLHVNFESATTYTLTKLSKGHHYIEADLDHLSVFIRPNHMLVLGESADCVEHLDASTLTALVYFKDQASYTLYDDDGVTPVTSLEGHLTHLTFSKPFVKSHHLQKALLFDEAADKTFTLL